MIDHILESAKFGGVQAIHPGYGFLSENAEFVQQCEEKNFVFIGPPLEAIRAMGSKREAKTIMEKAKVPILPGYHGANQDPNHLLAKSKEIGFPVMLKASYGGGGKGMRIVENEAEFMDKLESAKNESRKGFANDEMIIEKYVRKPRHIEV